MNTLSETARLDRIARICICICISICTQEVNVEVLAILNDTTGTLACGSFDDHECAVSMIIGTGSNACYLESVERVPKWREPRAPTLIVPNANANANGSSNQKQKQSVDANALELEREERAMRRAFYDGERQVYGTQLCRYRSLLTCFVLSSVQSISVICCAVHLT